MRGWGPQLTNQRYCDDTNFSTLIGQNKATRGFYAIIIM